MTSKLEIDTCPKCGRLMMLTEFIQKDGEYYARNTCIACDHTVDIKME